MPEDKQNLAQRLGWFVLLWLGGILALALIGSVIRYWLGLS
ncbi:hypothetical protein [Kiloniella laminariae]|nr:hypothetical protein [Kiloniella laminariae]